MLRGRLIVLQVVLGFIGTAVLMIQAQTRPATAGEWTVYGGGKSFQRYSPLDQIRRDNLRDLQV